MDSQTLLPDPTVLNPWLESLGYRVQGAKALAGDVSPRRYYRLFLGPQDRAILAYYPSDVRDTCSRFLTTTRLLQGSSVPVPAILGSNCTAGFMLLEDLGTSTLYDRRNDEWSSLLPYFEESLSLWRRIRSLSLKDVEGLNPPLDRDLLVAELRQTWDIYLAPHKLAGDRKLAGLFWSALEKICTELADGPRVVCHRDFMARNLVPLASPPELGILDHQDLRAGPAFYDLASVLNDSLFPPREIETSLVSSCLASEAEKVSYHRAAVQRTLKVVGTFEAFARRGNPRRLRLIPPTLAKALYHLRRVPEAEGLTDSLAELWKPALEARA